MAKLYIISSAFQGAERCDASRRSCKGLASARRQKRQLGSSLFR